MHVKQHKIGLFTVFTGDICNLACTVCNHTFSTRWKRELGISNTSRNKPDEFDYSVFSNAKKVVIGGGEPLLNKQTFKIMENSPPTAEIYVHFNGTVLPSDRFMKLCSKFDNISFAFSIDDIGEQFEYLRYPAKWDSVSSNILHLREICQDNITFEFNITICQLNKESHTRVIEWISQNIPCNRYGIKTEYYTQDANSNLDNEAYIAYLDRLDSVRGLSWRDVFQVGDIPITLV